MIKDAFRQMSQALKELIAGILLTGLVIEAAGIWFVSEKWYFTVGLVIGVVLALFMVIHMNRGIEIALELPEKDAQSYMQKMTVFRMGILILVMGAVLFLRLGNGISMFAGVLTLKFAAYLQPAMHRLFEKIQKRR